MSLENLPDELILNILGYVTIQDKINCGQTSKRIRAITQDETLWQRVDVNDKKVSTEFLEIILQKGCKFLDCNLAETLEGSLNLEHKSELRHLDVSSYFPPKQVLEKLLIANLEKLAMRNLTISQDLIFHICNKNSSSLQILNLGNCRGINPSIYRNLDFESIKIITKELIHLKEVDLSGSLGSEDSEIAIRYLVNNITINLEKINLANVENIGDDDIHILATRCKKLSSINLDQTQVTNGALNSLIEESKETLEELSVCYCYLVEIEEKVLDLQSMPRFKVLNCDYAGIENLRDLVPNLIINKKEVRIAKFWISDPCLSRGKSFTRD